MTNMFLSLSELYHLLNSIKILHNKMNIKTELNNQIHPVTLQSGKIQLPRLKIERVFKKSSSTVNNVKLSQYLIEIKNIISSTENKESAQREIEEKWLDIAKNSFGDISDVFKTQNTIFKKAHSFILAYHQKGDLKRKVKWVSDYLIHIEFIFLAFSHLITSFNKKSQTEIAVKIGQDILKLIWLWYFKEEYLTFEEFLTDKNLSTEKILNIGIIFVNIFSSEGIVDVFEKIYSFKDGKDEPVRLELSSKYLSEIKEKIIISPQCLPMVYKPELWSEDKKGGFLTNINDNKTLVTGSSQHNHKITLNDVAYESINYLNSQTFEINRNLLNYITNEGSYLIDNVQENDPKNYFNFLITLDIAKTFINQKLYLNVNIDWRGRIYVQSFYINYQGSDLSISLINLNKGQIITEEGLYYLYIYGANSYNDNSISKRSFEERHAWVVNNLDRIYSMDREFILKAESPCVFAAFCLTMKEIKENPKAEIKFPVFLDATCSGIQHFAAMVLDTTLAQEVNLIESDSVSDLYQNMVPRINKCINAIGQSDLNLSKLALVKLTRKEIKSIIMTKSYNVTTFGIIEQLKASVENIKTDSISKSGKKYTKISYNVPANNPTGLVNLNEYEINQIGIIINDNIFNHYPCLHSIFTFLTHLSKAMIELNLPIRWATPIGLKFTQSYVSSKNKKISINFLGKNKTAVLKEWIKDKTDNRKQVQAIIPNIVHSFDASHLISIVNSCIEKELYILPIHDCFGTHPNDMSTLGMLVRKKFIELYINKDFFETIYRSVISNLDDNRIPYEKEENGNIVINMENGKNKIIILPPPCAGDLDLNRIQHSKYMIC